MRKMYLAFNYYLIFISDLNIETARALFEMYYIMLDIIM